MTLNPITDSAVVTGESYDAETNTLTLRYKNGLYYAHENVDPQLYGQFQSAESKGKWLSANLAGKNAKQHPFTKIPPPEEQQ